MQKFKHIVICALSFVLIVSLGHCSEEGALKYVLDNGLTVVTREVPTSPVVSVFALVKAGSATEGKYLGSGLSHFLEHMLFKGTERRGVGQIPEEIQAVGGSINASTSFDYTIYTITVPYDHFDTALDVLSDMIMHAKIDEEEFKKERDVIFGEMRMHNDNPDRELSRMVFKNVYLMHPYRHPIIGYKSLFAQVTREQLLDYYKSMYVPNNIVLSIAGRFESSEIRQKIELAFKDFKRGVSVMRNLPKEPQQITKRFFEKGYPTDLTRLSVAFQTVPLLHQDLFALDVLAKILGHGKSSRLYVDLYKRKNLVHRINASNYTPIDQGLFEIESLLEYKNVDQAIKECLNHIKRIKAEGVDEQELDKAKRQVVKDHVFAQLQAGRIAYSQALDEAFAGDYAFSAKYVAAVKSVTNEDIKRVAQKYFVDERLTVVILKPEEEKREENIFIDDRSIGGIEKVVLKNGMTVLLKEDHTFPVASLHLSLNGGLRQEPEELNGISKLAAGLWIRGTKSKTANQIAEYTESQGINFASFSGKNSLGITISALTEDMDEALNLLEGVVKHPTFPEDELVKLKEIQKVNLRKREDSIFHQSFYALKEMLFEKHPYRFDENGSKNTIDRITRDDIIRFYQRLAVPNNMVLSIYGDIKPDELKDVLEDKFSDLLMKELVLKDYYEAPLTSPKEEKLTLDKEQSMFFIGFHGASMHSQDRRGLEILTAIIGSSFSGRLFSRVRDEFGQAYTLGGHYRPGIDTGIIDFYVLTESKNIPKVRKIVEEEIKNIQSTGVLDQEFQDAKTYLKGSHKTSYETNQALSFMTNLDELYGLGYDFYLQYDEQIDEVSKDDVQNLAKKYLDLNKAAIIITENSE